MRIWVFDGVIFDSVDPATGKPDYSDEFLRGHLHDKARVAQLPADTKNDWLITGRAYGQKDLIRALLAYNKIAIPRVVTVGFPEALYGTPEFMAVYWSWKTLLIHEIHDQNPGRVIVIDDDIHVIKAVYHLIGVNVQHIDKWTADLRGVPPGGGD